jgi:hypothetical protein
MQIIATILAQKARKCNKNAGYFSKTCIFLKKS